MGAIHAKDLTIAFRSVKVISGLNIEIADGEFVVLLGPSGCGKSTLLNAVAGLLDVSAGEIWIGGRNVTGLEPKDRGLAMVFQSYALYPNMDVYGNLAFSLQVAGLRKPEIEKRVRAAAEMLELTPLLRRRPIQLSGGQRQRVAIGRAMVRDVDVFLFDEPLSNLDAQLRAELRVGIKELHKRLGSTMLYVTHDQVEALTLADRIAVMKDGKIQQIGDPDSLYYAPHNRFVAGFLGSPPMNFVPANLSESGGRPWLAVGDRGADCGAYSFEPAAGLPSGEVVLGIRPEQIALGDGSPKNFAWTTAVELREPLGGEVLLWVRLGGTRLAIKIPAKGAPRDGDSVQAHFAIEDVSLFDTKSGRRV